MNRKWIFFGLQLLVLAWQANGQVTRKIPVYPRAKLVIEEEGEKPVCWSFATNDSYEKVLAFYESKLNTKAMDITPSIRQ